MVFFLAIACRTDESPKPDGSDPSQDPTTASCPPSDAAFAPAVLLAEGYEILDLVDWDGDGDLDIAVQQSGRVEWLENLGAGAWSEVQPILPGSPTDGTYVPIGFLDVDHDGDVDLLGAWRSSWVGYGWPILTLWWNEQLEDGNIGMVRDLVPAFDALETDIRLGDVDADGDTDIVCSTTPEPPTDGPCQNNLGTLQWIEHVGASLFNEPQLLPASERALPADLDGDDDLDLLEIGAWFENTGGANFVSHSFPDNVWPYDQRCDGFDPPFAVGDLDGDGDLDVVTRADPDYVFWDLTGPLSLSWFENMGGGLFAPIRRLTFLVWSEDEPSSSTVTIADLDADGDGDLVYSDATLQWQAFENLGNGVLRELDVVPRPSPGSGRVIVADLDGNGTADLLADHTDDLWTQGTTPGVSWFPGQLPRPPDVDSDGMCDALDRCPGHNDHLDSDADGVANGCDICASASDRDADGIPDDCDVCPDAPDTPDTDGDSVPDACDPCPTDPRDDSDGDDVCDGVDACEGLDDAGDDDADGVCNNLDLCFGDNAAGDTDLDHVCDSDDVCPGFPDVIDSDQDSIPDGCEAG